MNEYGTKLEALKFALGLQPSDAAQLVEWAKTIQDFLDER